MIVSNHKDQYSFLQFALIFPTLLALLQIVSGILNYPNDTVRQAQVFSGLAMIGLVMIIAGQIKTIRKLQTK